MNIPETIKAAHQNALDKGFYSDLEAAGHAVAEGEVSDEVFLSLNGGMVAQKLALIATEIREFKTAENDEVLEELADVVIRVFDLAGFTEYDGSDMYLGNTLLASHRVSQGGWSSKKELALRLYDEVADAVQAHRKNHWVIFTSCLDNIVEEIGAFTINIFWRGALETAIEEKMEKNSTRAHKHGARY